MKTYHWISISPHYIYIWRYEILSVEYPFVKLKYKNCGRETEREKEREKGELIIKSILE